LNPITLKRCKVWLAGTLCLLGSAGLVPAGAQVQSIQTQAQAQVQMLTLDQAINLAILNNPSLQASQARVGVSAAQIMTAGARSNPLLISDNGLAELTYRLGVQQTFQLGGKREHRVLLARAQRDVVLAEISTTLLDLRMDVRRAYTRLYNAQQRQSTSEEILEANQRLLAVAQKRAKVGTIPDMDVMQPELAVVQAKNSTQVAFSEVIQARNSLNILLNQPLSTSLQLAAPTALAKVVPTAPNNLPPEAVPLRGDVSLAQANLETLVQEALSRRPELQQNRLNLTVTQRQLDLARVNRIPDFILTAGPDFVTPPGGKTLSVFIMGSLELPVFNRQQGPIREAFARRSQLEKEQAALRNRITLDVANAFSSFTLNKERLTRYETDILPLAKMMVEKSQRSFEVGKTNILFPINAQQAYQQTRLDYLQAVQDYENAISDLERAVGTGL
jgi:cobalt-zinc-cadmium efflux system outer membrane protein